MSRFRSMTNHSGGIRSATKAPQSHSVGTLGAQAQLPASSWAGAAESVVRESDSAAAQQRGGMAPSVGASLHPPSSLGEEDEVDRALGELRVPRQPEPVLDPRGLVPLASSMLNPELGDLLLRLAAEHDRVARLAAKQDFIVGEILHRRRDREVEVRRGPTAQTIKMDDVVWADPIYRALNGALLLQQRVLNELKADLSALDRHHAAVSRFIELRRQEQERDLLSINLSSRRLRNP